ncbi:Pentatricopeptide repeat [Macleaya cordata]|uniref:Pentatricopeptide repeat n=1 Tax=Macleaya cordata TaxID=56857 RepID=A0A200Q2Y2_MACCD|nr:Pentatricopeptide repeat [Macleaya cordata]
MCIQERRTPDNYTFSTLLKSSGDLKDLKTGEMIHCRIIQTGFISDTVLVNSLMGMYFKCESYYNIRKLFDEMPQRSTASWNMLISGYTVLGNFSFTEDIWELVKQMQIEGVKLDKFTVSSLLPLCGTKDNTGKLDYGREIHCFALKNDMYLGSLDLHVGCCLIDMYSKNKKITLGRLVFDGMSGRNIVAWTAMITGYVQNGCSEEALMLFREMQLRAGIEPNRVSLVSILPACSSLAGLREGKQIHGFAIRNEFNHEVSLSNALIDMYSKCGSLGSARCIFYDVIHSKDAISWSSMIAGYGLHGNGDEAISLYNKMIQLGIKPDNITLVGVLSACSRSGLVNEGFEIYNSAVTDYGVSLTVEICACMVDMLGRAGQLDQALEFINSMPMKPGPSVWGALFGASVIHENAEMRDLASSYLIQLEPENPSNYVSLSNLHASFGKWDVVAELRRGMKDKGLRKSPGCSWITISNEIHSFYVADKTHPCSSLIYEMLDDLISMMKGSHDFPD